MTFKGIWAVSIIFCLAAAACGAPYATMQNGGLTYRDFAIEVKSISNHKPRFVEGNWNLDNWIERGADSTWQRKDAPNYRGDVFVDMYANGSPSKIKDYFSEIVLDHDGSISTITIDVTKGSVNEWDISIEDVYQRFVDNMAAREPWYAGKRFEKSVVDKQSKIEKLNAQKVQVNDYEGIVGYVNRTKFDSEDKDAEMKYAIFLLRLKDVATLNRTKDIKGTKENIPVMVSVILESEPEEFNTLVDDFYEVIQQIKIKQKDIVVDYVNPSLRPVDPCDEKGAQNEGNECPNVKPAEKNEDIIGPQTKKKKKKK